MLKYKAFNGLIERVSCPECDEQDILRHFICPSCDGASVDEDGEECPNCEGHGYIACPTCGGRTFLSLSDTVSCPACGGRGAVPCPVCDGEPTERVEALPCCGKCETAVECELCRGEGRITVDVLSKVEECIKKGVVDEAIEIAYHSSLLECDGPRFDVGNDEIL